MTTQIKKVFVELVNFLEENKNKKVDTILPQIIEMCETKVTTKTFRTNEQGETTEILCWYFKEWMPVEEFAPKKNTASGYNQMCRAGVRAWTKKQRESEKLKLKLHTQHMNNEITLQELQEKLEKVETWRKNNVELLEL